MLQFPEDLIPADLLPVGAYIYHNTLFELEKAILKNRVRNPSYKLRLELTNVENTIMAAKGQKKNDTTGRGNGGSNSFRRPEVVWVNIRLDDDDAEILAQSVTGLDELAAMVCSVVGGGGQFGLKPMDGGDSFMAYFIGKPRESDGTLCGLSAYSDDPAAALLCLCYKFHDKCAGEFPLPDSVAAPQSRRFR